MPAWIYVLAACAVAWVVFVVVFHPFRRGAHAAPRALPVRVDAGSMVLAEEATAWLSAPPWVPPAGSSDDTRTTWNTVPQGHRGHVESGCVPALLLAGPYGGQLGPRARAVLDRYNARCVERWGHAIAG